jgi:hypothetical protein
VAGAVRLAGGGAVVDYELELGGGAGLAGERGDRDDADGGGSRAGGFERLREGGVRAVGGIGVCVGLEDEAQLESVRVADDLVLADLGQVGERGGEREGEHGDLAVAVAGGKVSVSALRPSIAARTANGRPRVAPGARVTRSESS